MRSVSGKPLFIFLLPVFFFLHAYNVNFAPGLAGTVFMEIIQFSLIGLVITSLLFLFFRDWQKAALPGFFLLSFNFFFGSIQDLLKQQLSPGSLFLRYSFIIPFVLLLLVVLIIYLKRSKKKFEKPVYFLNLLFAVFIVIELAGLVPRVLKRDPNKGSDLAGSFITCDTCAKPDVYLIITDEYAGRRELKEVLSFDNTDFENELQKRGFHVTGNSRSNYNGTVYSIASMMNMNYLQTRGKGLVTQGDMLLCRSIINNNNTGRFFRQEGYAIHNCSFFDVQGEKRPLTNYYFYSKSRILTFETFINRFQMHAGFNFFSKEQAIRIAKHFFLNDEAADSLTRQAVLTKTNNPKFVYTHFTRPHQPYFVDRNGKLLFPDYKLPVYERVKREYTEHLLYTNKRLLQLLDYIQQHSARPPVILLASDHGFRQMEEGVDKNYQFMNLFAINLPSRQYEKFNDSITIVNSIRTLLNTEFGQRLPLLKDSSIFLSEKSLW